MYIYIYDGGVTNAARYNSSGKAPGKDLGSNSGVVS